MCSVDMLGMFGSPPAGFLTDYTPIKLSKTYLPITPLHITFKAASRSCLKSLEGKTKKRVVFADDRGLALEHVRVMTEPSDIPPYWALRIVASPPVQRKTCDTDTWEIMFKQPASDYVEFRRRITEDCVSLENVIVRSEGALYGTIKVNNLDFSKEVFVRVSADGWCTYDDHFCAFLESGPMGKKGVSLYDTFEFRIQLPIHSRRIEFCVCFLCSGKVYWDNNVNLNYAIEKSSVKVAHNNCTARINSGNSWIMRTDCAGNTPYW